MPSFWWVNQNQTYKAEVGGGYMWSPKVNKDGGQNHFYKNMTICKSGDIVFSFADTLIKTVGIISAPARTSDRPAEFGKAGEAWDIEGWLVQVEYEELQQPIKPKDHMNLLAPLLPSRYSPIRANGSGNQVYLASIPSPMGKALLDLIGSQLEAVLEEGQERIIQNRTDIGATQKYQLVRSRVGQGQYRRNLEQYEARCRITGVTQGQFLTASHIKPWSKSSDFEKIDGNNGLLLAPHVDRLFDRGYISFEDNGTLLMSPSLPKEVVSAWGLSTGYVTHPFTKEQAVYMKYHRANLFRRS
jgi:putative restriction endonuclease